MRLSCRDHSTSAPEAAVLTRTSSSMVSVRSSSGGIVNRRSRRVIRRVVRRSVRMKVRRLQKLVPGGRGLEPEQLFLQAANYILHLRLQVNVLQALSKLYKP